MYPKTLYKSLMAPSPDIVSYNDSDAKGECEMARIITSKTEKCPLN
uniref:ADF-H domain-containing protein n=1 Tax=Ascaris lumbricoides TaxID=6252 RepID=A0A0M3IGZ3_ASCLU